MGEVVLVLLSPSSVAALDDKQEAEAPFSVAFESEKKSREIT